MTATLVLTGGRGHPASATSDQLDGLVGDRCCFVDDLDAGWRRLGMPGPEDLHGPDGPDALDRAHEGLHPADVDLLVVNALAFDMSDDGYDDATRAAHAYRIPDAGRAAIGGWVGAGRPLLVLHTGLVSFGDWDDWRHIVGGAWEWGRSSHPPVGAVDVEVEIPTADVPPPESGPVGGEDSIGRWTFTVTDERYCDLWLADDVEVVARSAGHPMAWRRVTPTGGRVAASALGHDAVSLAEPGHRRLIRSLVEWLLEDR